MKVINFYGGPGVGKSTMTAALFYEMKKRYLKVELAQEYAKEMVYEKRDNILADQIYIFAKQHRRLLRLIGHNVDFAVADSPLLTSLFYTNPEYFPSFTPLVVETFNSFDNINILLERHHPYDPDGRIQKTEDEARVVDEKVIAILDQHNIQYYKMVSSNETVHNVLRLLGAE